MMIGEFEFDDTFFDNPKDPDNAHFALLPYRNFTLCFFLCFMMIMSIIFLNLLVTKLLMTFAVDCYKF